MILPKGTSIPFVNIAQDFFDSGYKEKTQKFFVVTNQTELGALPSLGIRVGINLSDYFMIVAFHGHRDAGSSRIDIVNITQSDDEIRVMIGTSEWWGAPVDAEVSPYHAVAVKRGDLTKKGRIEFVFFDVSGRKLDKIEEIRVSGILSCSKQTTHHIGYLPELIPLWFRRFPNNLVYFWQF